MIHKARSNIEEVPYCFSRSSVKFEGHKEKSPPILTQIWHFRTVTLFEFIDGHEMKHKARSSIEEVPYWFSMSSVKFQGHTAKKIVDFDTNWVVPDHSLNLPTVMKWCTQLEPSKPTTSSQRREDVQLGRCEDVLFAPTLGWKDVF